MVRKRNKGRKTNNRKRKMQKKWILIAVVVLIVITYYVLSSQLLTLLPQAVDNYPEISRIAVAPKTNKAGEGMTICAEIADDIQLKKVSIHVSNGAKLAVTLPNIKSITWCGNITMEKAGVYIFQVSVEDSKNQMTWSNFTRSVL